MVEEDRPSAAEGDGDQNSEEMEPDPAAGGAEHDLLDALHVAHEQVALAAALTTATAAALAAAATIAAVRRRRRR